MAHNNFPPEYRYLFEETWKCMWCGRNTANAQHHIVGRGDKNSMVESSILNCAWLCNYPCHINIHPLLRHDDNIRMLIEKTYELLDQSTYVFSLADDEFIKKYSHYYNFGKETTPD